MELKGRRPPGYMTKTEAAEHLGISEKTLERRLKTEAQLARVLRIGRRVWLLASDVESYFRKSEQRGYI